MSTGLDAPFHVLIVSFTTFTYGLAINNESESCSSVSNCKNFKFTEKEKANFEYLETIAREIIEDIENINQKKRLQDRSLNKRR